MRRGRQNRDGCRLRRLRYLDETAEAGAVASLPLESDEAGSGVELELVNGVSPEFVFRAGRLAEVRRTERRYRSASP